VVNFLNVEYEGDEYYARGGLRTGGEKRVTELGGPLEHIGTQEGDWAITTLHETFDSGCEM